jgi:formylmethanofuran dehydrogenase subunit C
VYDNWGRIVTQGSVEVKGDQAKISFRGAELTNGNLMLIIEGETLSQQRLRFIKSE